MISLEKSRLRVLQRLMNSIGRWSVALGRAPRIPEHQIVGQRGEEAAFFYLRSHGFVVVARGWRNAKLRGDLDLVAWEGPALCFVEVKTRSSRSFAAAESAVDEEKVRMLRRMAREYVRGMPSPPPETRFDVLSIYFQNGRFENGSPETEIIRGAFDWY